MYVLYRKVTHQERTVTVCTWYSAVSGAKVREDSSTNNLHVPAMNIIMIIIILRIFETTKMIKLIKMIKKKN